MGKKKKDDGERGMTSHPATPDFKFVLNCGTEERG